MHEKRPGSDARRRRLASVVVGAAAALLACWPQPSAAASAGPPPETVAAFERHVADVQARLDEERHGSRPFLWLHTLPPERQRRVLAKLVSGEVIVERLAEPEAPGGLIHHWVATALLPGVQLSRVVDLMQDYEAYAAVYGPAVQDSALISRTGPRFRVFLRLFTRKVVTVVLDTDYIVEYVPAGPDRFQVHSVATRVEEAGAADHGFVWRLNTYCALEARVADTVVQCESVTLSRAIPFGLAWLVSPFVTSVPRESLTFTLERMRDVLVEGDRRSAATP